MKLYKVVFIEEDETIYEHDFMVRLEDLFGEAGYKTELVENAVSVDSDFVIHLTDNLFYKDDIDVTKAYLSKRESKGNKK